MTTSTSELRQRIEQAVEGAYAAGWHDAETDGEDWNPPQPVMRALEALIGEREALLDEIERALLSHTTGGDPGMIFDEDDAAVERRRNGYWTIDDRAIDKLRAHQNAKRAAHPAEVGGTNA